MFTRVVASGQFESLRPGRSEQFGWHPPRLAGVVHPCTQSRESCRLLSRTALRRKNAHFSCRVPLSGCSPTTTRAPFLIAPTGWHCVIGVAVFGPCCRGTVRPCSALGCEELWPPADPFCGVHLRSWRVCSFQFHEEDGTRPPPLPGQPFTDRNPFVLIKVSCA